MEPQAGIAVCLPAYNEAANLEIVTIAALTALAAISHSYTVIIVNDGSRDDTAVVAEALVRRHPERIRVIHHPKNRGYGAAVRTGLAAGLATGLPWVFTTDADGQFNLQQLAQFAQVAAERNADMVIGYRKHRADSLIRRFNAKLWGWACRLLLEFRVQDVDCAFKLIKSNLLESIDLSGEAATISPELLAKAHRLQARVVELEVEHYPRKLGKQTGANFCVILRSLIGLLAVRRQLRGAPE